MRTSRISKPARLRLRPPGPRGRQTPFVRQHRERIRLINLRQLTAPKKYSIAAEMLFGLIRRRRHVLDVLEAHAFLHGARSF